MTFPIRTAAKALAATLLTAAALASHAAAPLPKLNIDANKTTVSGLSSGAFMANQLGNAYAATFKGVGVFAGGPYMCAGHSNYTACMYNATISSAMLTTMQADINNWSGTSNDNKSNVAAQKIFMFVGTSDTTVGPNPMNAVKTQYTNSGVPAANITYVQRASTAHVFPTDFDSAGDNACNSSASPYISNCGYDGAGAMFTLFYGTLNPRNNAPAAGNYIQFDQTAFTTNPGMATTGWLYVPASCAGGAVCKLHVALHGCVQNYDTVGDKFLKSTGYTRWADSNGIVVLFPQTRVDSTSRATAASGSLPNPNGCWDWIGWYGANFAQKAGTQAAAIKAMVDQVSSGTGGGGGGGSVPAAPTGVGTSGATNTTMAIAWASVAGATGYNVYRGPSQVNPSAVTGTNFTDTGLTAATTYNWTVTALNASGESPHSAAATGTTTGTAQPPATCVTASNYAHTMAGRAYVMGGYALANGSNQNMGLWNIYISTTLKKTGTNFYAIGSCP